MPSILVSTSTQGGFLPWEIKKEKHMEHKVDNLYDLLQKTYAGATEENRLNFKDWFLRNDMRSFLRSFYDNDLNIDATAKEVSLGRTTVLFRLRRIEHFTGLNIRKFSGAVELLFMLNICDLV